MRVHMLQNVQIALNYIKFRKVKLVNIRPEDIVDGNQKLILGLIWTIILHFQLAEIVDDNSNFREILLRWAQRTCDGYPGTKVTDLTTSFRDGLAFNAIIHRNRPDLIDYRACRQHTARENLDNAFRVAERDLNVTRLLDPEDVDVPQPDEKSMITYLAQLYELFPDPPLRNPLEDEEMLRRIDEYKELATRLLSWIKESTAKLEDRKFPKSARELKLLLAENDRFRTEEIPPKQHDKQRLANAAREVMKMAQELGVRIDSELQMDNIEYHWNRMMTALNARHQALSDALARAEKADSALNRFNVKLDALKKELNDLEKRIDSMKPPSRDPDVLRRQLEEMREFEARLAKARRSYEDLNEFCEDLIRQELVKNPRQLRDDVKECRVQLERIEAKAAKRMKELEGSLSHTEKVQAAMKRLRVKLDALKKELDELERRIDSMAPPAKDREALRRQLEEMREFETRLSKARRLFEEVNDLCEQMIHDDLVSNPRQLREEIADCKAQLERIEAKAAKRMRDLEGALTHTERAEAAMAKLRIKLDTLKKELDELERRVDSLGPPGKDRETLERQLDEIRDIQSRVAKARRLLEDLSELGEQMIRDNLVANPRKLRDDIAECRAQLERIESKLAKRQRDLEDALVHTDKADAAMKKFNLKLDAIIRELDDLERRLQSMGPIGMDIKTLQKQLAEMEDFGARLDKCRANIESANDFAEDMIRDGLASNPDHVRGAIKDCQARLAHLEAAAADRAKDLRDALDKVGGFTALCNDLLAFLDDAERRFADLGPIGADFDTVKSQVEELKSFKRHVEPRTVDIENLQRQAQELIEMSVSPEQTASVREPLNEINRRWNALIKGINGRQQDLESALLRIGQFEHALQELLSWLTQAERNLQRIRTDLAGADVDVIEAELAKMRAIQNDIESHGPSVESINKAGRALIESSANSAGIQSKLDSLNERWQALQSAADKKQGELEDALTDAIAYNKELQELFTWLQELDQALAQAKPVGGLPETAREQLDSFMELWQEIDTNRGKVESTLKHGADLLRLPPAGRGDASKLVANIKTLRQRWDGVQARAAERKQRLEQALREAEEFHEAMQKFLEWLTSAEQYFGQLEPVSRLVDRVNKQIEQHKEFAREVNGPKREQMLELDKKATHLKYFAQKQDVIVIKNLMTSIVQRWERVVAKTAERSRALEAGLKEAKEFADAYNQLMQWLDEAQKQLAEAERESTGGLNDPEQIKILLAKHKEYQRALGARQAQYDNVMRMGRALKERAPRQPDQPIIQQMLDDLRDKWNAICNASVERQRRLEEALLYSGQFKDACSALIEWLDRARAMLLANQRVHGDLDTVSALCEQHRAFQADFASRQQTLDQVRRTAQELQSSGGQTSNHIAQQMQILETKWSEVARLSDERSARLDDALRMAQQLHEQVHQLLEWLADAEIKLRFAGSLPDDIELTRTAIGDHERFMQDLQGQQRVRDSTLQLAREILQKAHPDAEPVVKHWITIIESRWDEIAAWAQQRGQRLADHMRSLEDIMQLIEQLISWLVGHETRLVTEQIESLPDEIPRLESMIEKHQSFIEELRRRETDVDRVFKILASRTAGQHQGGVSQKNVTHLTTVKSRLEHTSRSQSKSSSGSRLRTPSAQKISTTFASYKDEYPELSPRHVRARIMLDKWRAVWQLALDKMQRIRDHIDYQRESARLEHFDFDEWRRRYLSWMNNKKARIMDFYRSIDKDNDGRVPDDEFIEAFMRSSFTTSKLEMDKVIGFFDKNKDGHVDHKEYLDALRPDRPITEEEIIQDEVQRQVSKCTCQLRYKVYHVGEGRYRFGESQKLRLVRILRSVVMVRVGGGWVSLDEFLSKNDPCRARGRTNVELREQFILPEGAHQTMATFKSKLASGATGANLSGPITKIREKSDRSIPMHHGSTHRLAAAGSPSDYYSDAADSTTGIKPGSRPTRTSTSSRPSSRPASATQEY